MSKQLLVITDSLEEQVRMLLLLTAAGYTPTCCDSALSAFTALSGSTFDAIIADSVISESPLRQMAAVEFVSLVRETSLNADTPVIVKGDFISLQHMMDTLRSGAARFVPTPCTPSELLETIAAELSLPH